MKSSAAQANAGTACELLVLRGPQPGLQRHLRQVRVHQPRYPGRCRAAASLLPERSTRWTSSSVVLAQGGAKSWRSPLNAGIKTAQREKRTEVAGG
uniref:Uncharacterized protein n=1 Tax=Arundo donax TaxID=35708 RepID=A0A0A9GUR7_ARUDO